MLRPVASLTLVFVSVASFAQITGVSRDCDISYAHFIGNGGDVLDKSGTIDSDRAFADNALSYGHTDTLVGVGYSGLVSTAAVQSVTVSAPGSAFQIAVGHTASASMDGKDTLRIAQTISTIRYVFNVATASTVTINGTDNQHRFGNDVRLDEVGGGNLFQSFFATSGSTFNFTGTLAPGQYRLSAVAAETVIHGAGPEAQGDLQVQIFNLQVALVPEPASMAALSLGALGILRRRKARGR